MILESWKTFAYFIRAYPVKGLFLIAAFTVAGLLEGIGIAALLPLIVILTGQQESSGTIAEFARTIFSVVGLEPGIAQILLFIVGIMIVKAIVSFVAVIQISTISAQVSTNLRTEYIERLLGARWLHYIGLHSGASANALGYEAQRAALAFKLGCQALSYGLQIVAYSILASFVSLELTLGAFVAGGLLLFVLNFLVHESRKAGGDLTSGYNSILTLVTDALFGAKPLKAMNKSEHLYGMLKKDIQILQSSQKRLDLVDQSLVILAESIMVVLVALGLYAAVSFSNLPVPELLFMAVVFLRMVMRISSMQRAYQSMAGNESALWALRGKIDAARAAVDDYGGKSQPSLTKSLGFENVSFAYQSRPVLDGLSVELETRKFYLIFGPSGSGKTTFVDLAIGLLKPDTGEIYLDGIPLSSIDKRLWRQNIGYVPQDILLFHDTIYNNITLNDPTLSRADVEEALKKSGAYEFVRSLDSGLDTVVGERGSRLSGGQRQRLALARAIVHHPRMLVLDEATSALDKETEAAVLETIKTLSREMLILAISHNENMMSHADHVYYLRDGQITQKK